MGVLVRPHIVSGLLRALEDYLRDQDDTVAKLALNGAVEAYYREEGLGVIEPGDAPALDDARRALFTESRALQKAHEYRLRSFKSDMDAVQKCRDADRELQRAAIRFTAALAASIPGKTETIAELIAELEVQIHGG